MKCNVVCVLCRYRNRVEFKGCGGYNGANLWNCRYRNRVEFKDNSLAINGKSFDVDIETEWNLKRE